MMKKPVVIGIIVTVVLLAVVAGSLLLQRGHQAEHAHEHGSDDHVVINPVESDPLVAAEAAMTAVLSFDPSKQETPFEQYAAARDQLTGQLAQVADNPPTGEFAAKQFPAEWQSWAASKDRVQAFVTRAPGTEPVDADAESAVVSVDVRQMVMHADGDRTPWRVFVAEVQMRRVDGHWRAESYVIK